MKAMSLIGACFLCSADPFEHLTRLVRTDEQAAGRPAEWMPWNCQARVAAAGARAAAAPGSGPAHLVSAPVDPAEPGKAASPDTSQPRRRLEKVGQQRDLGCCRRTTCRIRYMLAARIQSRPHNRPRSNLSRRSRISLMRLQAERYRTRAPEPPCGED
jgi:hypothetical protein